MKITVETMVSAPLEEVWRAWTTPDDILQWNAASDDWHPTNATLDLRAGGDFSYRMAAKDGSAGFDFAGTFTRIAKGKLIAYSLGDGRAVEVEFVDGESGVRVRETFDADATYPVDQQREGWQAILNRFASHVESLR